MVSNIEEMPSTGVKFSESACERGETPTAKQKQILLANTFDCCSCWLSIVLAMQQLFDVSLDRMARVCQAAAGKRMGTELADLRAVLVRLWVCAHPDDDRQQQAAVLWVGQMMHASTYNVSRWLKLTEKRAVSKDVLRLAAYFQPKITALHLRAATAAGLFGPQRPTTRPWLRADRLSRAGRRWLTEARQEGWLPSHEALPLRHRRTS